VIELDEIDISEIIKEICKRAKCIYVSRKLWGLLKRKLNRKNIEENWVLKTVKKGVKKGDEIKLLVIPKSHQDFQNNLLGDDKEILRVGIEKSDFEKLSQKKVIDCELFCYKDTLNLVGEKFIIVTIIKSKKLKEIITTLQKKKTIKRTKTSQKELKERLLRKRLTEKQK